MAGCSVSLYHSITLLCVFLFFFFYHLFFFFTRFFILLFLIYLLLIFFFAFHFFLFIVIFILIKFLFFLHFFPFFWKQEFKWWITTWTGSFMTFVLRLKMNISSFFLDDVITFFLVKQKIIIIHNAVMALIYGFERFLDIF